MEKSYLLLHNNQQSGPFSLEELAGKALQAKDLVWVIGQSAGWRYPEEIEALKTFVQDNSPIPSTSAAGEPKKEVVSSQTIATFTTEKAASPSTRHIYVSFPSNPVTIVAEQAAVPEAATQSFEERVEKMRQRVACAETQKEIPQEPEVETKYSRSLDDIKAEYSSWMHKRKRRPNIDVKQIVIAATLFLGVVMGAWTVYHFISNSSTSESGKKDERLVEFHPTPVQPASMVKTNKVTQGNRRSNKAGRQSKNSNNLFVKATQREKSNDPVAPPQAKEGDIAANEKNNSPGSATEKQTTANSEKAAAVVDQLQLQADYVAANKRQQGVGGLEVAIKNNSNQMMKVVAVDVIYYGEGMEEIDRKTLYFSDLQPGQTLTRKAPAHKKAEGAYAQLGLISSEAGNIFYASN
ncbi:DUF4339 domain-containing protein [Flavisolibacter tropicus]|uniref:GYF domain-containing protein n=1 Tax=Flavisolibacter tropicus TaxID=1492898 RepID=A0A172U037_9BACT|nr:DUF4339 domain-containing protein [Flavisolibacter tropicus]ANE52715.1 hypothetical protein SY85_21780 [Flavisolibacter tropicus]